MIKNTKKIRKMQKKIHLLASIKNDFSHNGDSRRRVKYCRRRVGYSRQRFRKRVTIRSLFNRCSDGVMTAFGRFSVGFGQF